MSLNACHATLPAIFRARRHSPVICQRKKCTEGAPTPLPFHCTRSDSSPCTAIERWTVIPVQFTVRLHQAALINSFTHQFSDKSEGTSISILQINTTSFYQLYAGTPPNLSGIIPGLPVLGLMNLVLCSLVL